MDKLKHYDFIIAGGGLSGLSLAFYMNQSELKNKKILIIDKQKKNTNDRTWCFWENEESDFEKIIYKKWQKLNFFSEHFSSLLNFKPFQYKMIRGIDFYQYIDINISNNPNIEYYFGEIKGIINKKCSAEVYIDKNIFSANWVFSSIFNLEEIKNRNSLSFLLQHFKGWEIETNESIFNPEEATFMDFRIEQKEQCRFFYVLPISDTKALVEFTVFSPEILKSTEYNDELENYIKIYLKIDNYKINHEEFGVIPMTDAIFSQNKDSRIINIGTAAGRVKGSSGYAFIRIQQQAKEIVKNLIDNKIPLYQKKKINRFKFYDDILLHIMLQNLYPASNIFSDLFKNNPAHKILSFLNEESTFFEDLKIMSTTHYPPFIKSIIRIIKFKLYK